MNRSNVRTVLPLVAAAGLIFGSGSAAAAQHGPSSGALLASAPASFRVDDEEPIRSEALAKGRYAVVIDLDHNLLHFKQGEHTLWTAPIGTGTGLRMKDEDNAWDFSTPEGVFHVKFKERDPVWIAEDWYFVENGLPVPPPNDPKRYFPGGLGAAAVYIDHDLAIHGTDKPELLGQRVSHGCIRLSNKDALRLYHNVQVGTEVVIIGGKNIERQEITPAEAQRLAAAFKPGEKRPVPKDPLLESWKKMSTHDLLLVLDSELWEDAERSRWPEVAHLLSDRALKDDGEALEGLLRAALDLPDVAVEREYRTFVADAYARGGNRTLDALSRFNRSDRERLAAMIVDTSLDLFHGDLAGTAAPWPTRRIPLAAVDATGRSGWAALRDAEESYGNRVRRRST